MCCIPRSDPQVNKCCSSTHTGCADPRHDPKLNNTLYRSDWCLPLVSLRSQLNEILLANSILKTNPVIFSAVTNHWNFVVLFALVCHRGILNSSHIHAPTEAGPRLYQSLDRLGLTSGVQGHTFDFVTSCTVYHLGILTMLPSIFGLDI